MISRIPASLLALMLAGTPLHAADGEAPNNAAPQSPTSAPGQRVVPDPAAAIQADLARALDATTEVIWLDTDGQKTLALSMPHNTREKIGTVVILHDQRTSADWPELVSTLRNGLPDKGWATLSVQLPDAPYPPLPARGDSTVTEPAPTAASYAERIARLTDTVFAQAQEADKQLVILGVGTGAVWATSMVRAKEQSVEDLSLVLLDGRQPTHPQSPDLMTLLPELQSTVLDLYHGSTMVENMPANPRLRANLARRSEMDNFHQNRLPLLHGDRKKRNQWVLNRVRGYMQTHIVNAEANGKKGKRNPLAAAPKEEIGPGGSPVSQMELTDQIARDDPI